MTLIASHLTRRFDGRVAVDDLSFELVPGEIFALLGPNGAGKTTTLRMLAGLLSPTSGSIRVGDELMSRANAPRLRVRIGFLTEAPGLWDRLSVRRNLTVYARLHGLSSPDAVVDAALEAFDIRDRSDDPAATLSKGLKQRVALARTLLHQPDVILLDEPTSGLDPESAREVRGLILRLRDERRAILLSTHNLDEVERIASRVAVLRSRLVALDTPTALRRRLFGARLRVVLAQSAGPFETAVHGPGVSQVQLDANTLSVTVDDAAARAPSIVRRLVAAGADVQTIAPEEPTLEEVYIRLVGDGHAHE